MTQNFMRMMNPLIRVQRSSGLELLSPLFCWCNLFLSMLTHSLFLLSQCPCLQI